MKPILFVGALNKGTEPLGGAIAKNQDLLFFLKSKFSFVESLDISNFKRNPLVLAKLLFYIVTKKNTNIILSTSTSNTFKLAKLLLALKIKSPIWYLVLGGDIDKTIDNKNLNPNIFNYYKKVIVQGTSIQQELIAHGLNNTITLPNFRNITYLPSIKREDQSSYKRFVFLSRIIPEKGIPVILKAVDKLYEQHKEKFCVNFYGDIDEAYKETFLSHIANYDNVNYLGFLNLKNISNYDILSTYDAMLFPTYFPGEGFPGVIIDAYISGVPVIASKWNLNTDIIDDYQTGILIESKDSTALQKIINKILANEINLKRMSFKCQEKAKTYNIKNVLSDEVLKNLELL